MQSNNLLVTIPLIYRHSSKWTIVYSYANIVVCLPGIYLSQTIGFQYGLPGDIEQVQTRCVFSTLWLRLLSKDRINSIDSFWIFEAINVLKLS